MKINYDDWIQYRAWCASKGHGCELVDEYISWHFTPWDSYDHPRHGSHSGLMTQPWEEKILVQHYIKFRQGQGATWITISPDHNTRVLPYTPETINKITSWCVKWFDDVRYSYAYWCIEAGENESDPHLHVHALVQFNEGFSKNHSRDLKNYWNNKFNKSKLMGKDYYSRNVVGLYLQDKIDYMRKGTEGSDHGNFINLNIYGQTGELR